MVEREEAMVSRRSGVAGAVEGIRGDRFGLCPVRRHGLGRLACDGHLDRVPNGVDRP